jgi:hypothetical protein
MLFRRRNRKKSTNRTPLIWSLHAPDQGSTVGGLLSVSPPEERSIPKEAFADSFQKLYERCQQCVVKDGDYFEGQ